MRFLVKRSPFLLAVGLASSISTGWAQEANGSHDWEGSLVAAAPSETPFALQDGNEEEGKPKEANAQKDDSKDDSKDDDEKKSKAKKKDKDKDEEKPEPLSLAAPQGPVLYLKGERVIVRPGKEIENGQVIVRDGRIMAVGTDLEAPEGARVLEGAVICAGFMDSFSTLGLDRASLTTSGSEPSARTVDALDFFGPDHDRQNALKAGVLVAESHIAMNADFGGTGVLLRTGWAHDPEKRLLTDESAMWSRLERSGNVVTRVEEVDSLISKLESGGDYLKSWRTYETKLAEWEKEIAELEEELEKDFKKAKKDREKDIEKAKEKGKEHKEKRHKEPKPPRKPRFDPDKEILGRVIEGKMPLVVVATRAAVLRNLLEATKPFPSLRLVIAGGDQALHVAPELAARKIPVMVWPSEPLSSSSVPSDTRGSLELAGDLARAGIPVVIGSGFSGSSAALPLYASLAVGYGLPEEHALAAITTRPAAAFGMQNELGQVRRGRRAELLILDGDPLAVGTQVQFAISGGEVVLEPQK